MAKATYRRVLSWLSAPEAPSPSWWEPWLQEQEEEGFSPQPQYKAEGGDCMAVSELSASSTPPPTYFPQRSLRLLRHRLRLAYTSGRHHLRHPLWLQATVGNFLFCSTALGLGLGLGQGSLKNGNLR